MLVMIYDPIYIIPPVGWTIKQKHVCIAASLAAFAECGEVAIMTHDRT